MTQLPRGNATVHAFLVALKRCSMTSDPWSHLESQVAHAPSWGMLLSECKSWGHFLLSSQSQLPGETQGSMPQLTWEESITHLLGWTVAGSPSVPQAVCVTQERGTDLFLMGKYIFSSRNHRPTSEGAGVKFLWWPLGVGPPLAAPPRGASSLRAGQTPAWSQESSLSSQS